MSRTDPIAELRRLGQSVWLDQIDRTMIRSGALARYRDRGVTGVTANPTIFARALESADAAYADDVERRLARGQDAESIVWDLLVEDVQAAADLMRPVYERERGGDGFVSIEVSPEIARDTERTIAAARDLRQRTARPNVMVKIPATPAGLPAIQAMVAEGANINVTLVFAVERYVKVVEAFLAGLERLRERGGDLRTVHSVASFFVSRVDTKVDELLEVKPELAPLRGRAAVANSKLAYEMFTQLHSGPRWDALRESGATVQRCLWASTSTKNPSYRDVMYVEQLIGPATINTMPVATFEAFSDHGRVEPTLQRDVEGARRLLDRLAMNGIDLAAVTQELEDEGVAGFAKSFRASIERLATARARR
jgi:transaldolase